MDILKEWVKIGTAARDRNVCSGARSAQLILKEIRKQKYTKQNNVSRSIKKIEVQKDKKALESV